MPAAFNQPFAFIPNFNLPANYGNIGPFEANLKLQLLLSSPATFYFHNHLEALLDRGADANSVSNFGVPVLHAALAASYYVPDTVVKKLIGLGANLSTLSPTGHNALSYAFANNSFDAIKIISEQGGRFPEKMLKDPFYQGVETLLSKKNFTPADFKDIHCKNHQGEGLLHAAVKINDANIVKQVLKCGLDVALKNHLGQTALKLAKSLYAMEAIQSIVDHKLQDSPDLLKLSDFTLFKNKGDGITDGGFYHDATNGKWLLKAGHSYTPQSVVKEYIAGGLYKLFLGDNSPQTEMVIHNSDASFMIGSKLLANFQTLKDHIGGHPAWGKLASYGVDFPHTFNGKPVKDFINGIAAIEFLTDTDAHAANVGLIDHGDHYTFAKIDHGFSFSFPIGEPTLDGFRNHLAEYYSITLEKVGFDAVYQAITNISNTAFSTIEKVVCDSMANVKPHMTALELNALNLPYTQNQLGNLAKDLADYEDNLVSNLKRQHQGFQKIADFMGLEKAIIDHDWQSFKSGLSKGLTLETAFKPFYNSTKLPDMWPIATKNVTGEELLSKHWPEVAELLRPAKNNQPSIAIKDILMFDNPLDALLGHNNAEFKAPDAVPYFNPTLNMMAQLLPEVLAAHFEMAQF